MKNNDFSAWKCKGVLIRNIIVDPYTGAITKIVATEIFYHLSLNQCYTACFEAMQIHYNKEMISSTKNTRSFSLSIHLPNGMAFQTTGKLI
jgi:hypothetical protein